MDVLGVAVEEEDGVRVASRVFHDAVVGLGAIQGGRRGREVIAGKHAQGLPVHVQDKTVVLMLSESVDLDVGIGGQLGADLQELVGQGQATEGGVKDDGARRDPRDLEGEDGIRRERDVVEGCVRLARGPRDVNRDLRTKRRRSACQLRCICINPERIALGQVVTYLVSGCVGVNLDPESRFRMEFDLDEADDKLVGGEGWRSGLAQLDQVSQLSHLDRSVHRVAKFMLLYFYSSFEYFFPLFLFLPIFLRQIAPWCSVRRLAVENASSCLAAARVDLAVRVAVNTVAQGGRLS